MISAICIFKVLSSKVDCELYKHLQKESHRLQYLAESAGCWAVDSQFSGINYTCVMDAVNILIELRYSRAQNIIIKRDDPKWQMANHNHNALRV
jgi:hypothetical protein